MAAHMYDLPVAPPFPVYGLDDAYDGYRWLVIWNNQEERLYTVSLGHGHPGDPFAKDMERAAWLSVTTYLKTPRYRISDDPILEAGATGYEDAMFDAVLELAGRTHAAASHGNAWATAELNRAEWGAADERNAPDFHGPDWAADTITIDGDSHPSMTRRRGGWWATLVDLPTVAVAVTGPDEMADFGSLVDVRPKLAEYR